VHNRDLPREVRDLIQSSVPTMDALEILIFFCRHPDRPWTARQLVAEMSPTVVSESSVRDTLGNFESLGLLAREGTAHRFRPATDDLASACVGLLSAYNERPVTLIRTLYDIADSKKIQAFADAFRIRKEP
jgi:hypothetical protein